MLTNSKDSAQNIFDRTCEHLKTWGKCTDKIKLYIYKLESKNVSEKLGYESNTKMYKEIIKHAKQHKSTIYDFRNSALMEIELGLVHGDLATETLLILKQNTRTAEERNRVMEIAYKHCEEGKSPTKKIILKAIDDYYEECDMLERQKIASLKESSKKESTKNYDTESDDDDDNESDDDDDDDDDDTESEDNYIHPKKYGRNIVKRFGAEKAEKLIDMLVAGSSKALNNEYWAIRETYNKKEWQDIIDGIEDAIE